MFLGIFGKPQNETKNKTRKKSKYASKLLVSFLLLLSVSIAITLILYIGAENSIRTDTLSLKDAMLKESASAFHKQITTAEKLTLNTETNSMIQRAATFDLYTGAIPSDIIYKARVSLSSIFQDTYQDLFVYFSSSERIVSAPCSCVELDLYLSTYYANSSITRSLLYALLRNPATPNVRIIDNQIMVSMPLMRTDKSASALIVCMLKPSEIVQLQQQIAQAGGFLVIADMYGNSLQPADSPHFDISSVLQELKTQNFISVKSDGSDYVLQLYTPTSRGLHYIWVTPAEIFWKPLSTLRLIYTAMCILELVLGICLSVILTRRSHRPITSLYKDLSQQTSLPPCSSENEIDYIRHVLFAAIDDKQRTSKALAIDFVKHALQGLCSTQQDVIKAFNEYDIHLLSDRFRIFAIRIETDKNSLTETVTQDIENVFNGYFEENNIRCYGMLIRQRHLLYNYLINYSDAAMSKPFDARRLAEHVINEVRTRCGITLTISSGSCLRGWDGISSSCQQAAEAMQYRTVHGPGGYLEFSDAPMREFRYSYIDRAAIETDMISCIKLGSPSPEVILERLKQAGLGGETMLPSEFSCYRHDLYQTCANVFHKLEVAKEVILLVSDNDNLPALDKAFIALLNEVHEWYLDTRHEKDEQRRQGMYDQVMEYICQHLSDPALCTESVGEHFSLSGPYLSKSLKNHTGYSISGFITQKRVELVKDLLLHSEANLDMIAEQSGFRDSATLIRVFKKAEGMTPGTYKKIHVN